jgi:LemA protein
MKRGIIMMQQSPTIAEATDLKGRTINAINFALDYWWLWVVLAIALWIVWKFYRQHKLLAELDERADAAFGDVDAMLMERKALLHNLSATVRSFANMEKGVIHEVLLKRVDAIDALDGSLLTANTQIAGALQNLFSLNDQYPDLASDEHYKGLRADLIRVEEKLTASRKFYNLSVEEMNSVRRTFPANLFAAKMGVKDREKFSLGERRAEFADPIQIEI